MRIPIYKQISFTFIITIMFFSLAEITARMIEFRWKNPFNPPKTDSSHYQGYFRKGIPPFGYNIPISLNSLGLRDDDISSTKIDDTYRILCVGDSYTFGMGVNREDTFVQKLEILLNENPLGKKYDVINAGHPGWGIIQELEFLKNYGLQLNPDLVILTFVKNDITDIVKIKNPVLLDSIYSQHAPIPFLLKSSLYNFLCYGIFWLVYNLHITKSVWEVFPLDRNLPPIMNAWEEYRINLREFVKTVRSKSQAPILLLIFPEWSQVLSDNDNLQKKLINMAASNNISYLDLLPIFKKYHNRYPMIFMDGHPNEWAHLLTAKSLYLKLTSDLIYPNK